MLEVALRALCHTKTEKKWSVGPLWDPPGRFEKKYQNFTFLMIALTTDHIRGQSLRKRNLRLNTFQTVYHTSNSAKGFKSYDLFGSSTEFSEIIEKDVLRSVCLFGLAQSGWYRGFWRVNCGPQQVGVNRSLLC